MATFFVSDTGSNTSPYDTWAKAATSLATAVTEATTSGDVIKVDKEHIDTLSANTTYTLADRVNIYVVDKDNADALAEMDGSTGYIGRSDAASYAITFAGTGTNTIYGRALRVRGAGGGSINLASTEPGERSYYNCKFLLENTNAAARINLTTTTANIDSGCNCTDCSFVFGSTGQSITYNGNCFLVGGSIGLTGSVPSVVFKISITSAAFLVLNGVDMSALNGTLVGSAFLGSIVRIVNSKLHASVSVLESQTRPPSSSASVEVYNSASGDEHYLFANYNSLGETIVSTGIYANDGAEWNAAAAKYSWKITTTSNANYNLPYASPWIHKHHEGTSAITPSLEGFRDGSTTVIQNDEVWPEFSYQGTTGFPLGVIVNSGRMSPNGSPANQTSSKTYSDWQTGTSADSTFKLATTSTITPSEIGNLSARVCVGEPETTVYVDPKIRT